MSNPLTQDKAAEGANLRRLLAGVNYSQFAREHKLDKSMIGQQMRGQRPISLHYATVYAQALDKTIGEISAYWGAKIAAAQEPNANEDVAGTPMFLRRVEEPMQRTEPIPRGRFLPTYYPWCLLSTSPNASRLRELSALY